MIHLELSPANAKFIQDLINRGEYPTAQDAIDALLCTYREQQAREPLSKLLKLQKQPEPTNRDVSHHHYPRHISCKS